MAGDAETVAGSTLIKGTRVIFWLFVVLAAGSAVGLSLFANTELGRPHTSLIYRALAGDLAIPVVAWFVIRAIEHRRKSGAS